MSQATPQIFRLIDYAPPPFLIDTVALDIDFQAGVAIVGCQLSLRRNPLSTDLAAPLVLDGEDLELLQLSLDGVELDTLHYELTDAHLTLHQLPDFFVLHTLTRIKPDTNTQLSGLYRSEHGYFTQCEAQGFRRITWFLDRPDIMSVYTVTLHADQTALPQLLSNGHPIASGQSSNGRHWVTWQDPYAKPCYLFAVVAAKLDVLNDTLMTASGRNVQLAIYVDPGKRDQCAHAMLALKKAMRWDEETFGLECDLDHYMIVAVGDFNMGAMENKGLNIFNTKFVLARPDVATDSDYENIDRVVAHEYFHNWTGNRVTCRDWFQLSLKEGLTVFRDQEFGADVHNRSVARIRDVRGLRSSQFPEDAGPMSHPVRPHSYIEINNFYTATIYDKGAELVRMIHTLAGSAAFRRGMDLYFQRHDGMAVTCDDFVAAMADASGVDFTQFMRWYDQPGTPKIQGVGRYVASERRYVLTLTQICKAGNLPFHIPVVISFLGSDGQLLSFEYQSQSDSQCVVSLQQTVQEFIFDNIAVSPVPSLLRGFSAPVELEFEYTDAELAHLLTYDTDLFNRWEAGQRLATRFILYATHELIAGRTPVWPVIYTDAVARVLSEVQDNPAFAAEVLSLPSEATLAEQLDSVDPDILHAARISFRRHLVEQLHSEFVHCYDQLASKQGYRFSPQDVGRRALRNVCLGYLCEMKTEFSSGLALKQFLNADNMTDEFAALAILAQFRGDDSQIALARFYQHWHLEPLVVDKWFQVQASARGVATCAEVEQLVSHPAFDIRNPNKVYALLRTFGHNHACFHGADGRGYHFMAEQIIRLDAINPQVASRLARCFDRWRKFDAHRQSLAQSALEMLHQHKGLSRDVFEVVERTLLACTQQSS